jgi:hypothetical protein
MRPFYSTPSTTIPNDSGSFAELYGGMISAKKEIHSLWRTILADTRYTNQRRYNLFWISFFKNNLTKSIEYNIFYTKKIYIIYILYYTAKYVVI